MLCYFLLDSKMNQPYIYTYPLPLGLPSCSDNHSVLSKGPCAIQHVLTSYFTQCSAYIRKCMDAHILNKMKSTTSFLSF